VRQLIIITSPAADDDIRKHVQRFLAVANADIAHRFVDAVRSAYELLAFQPIGPYRDFGDNRLKGVRTYCIRMLPGYMIAYRATETEIHIERVLRFYNS
jgi:plasmid stabilization system protein ParE